MPAPFILEIQDKRAEAEKVNPASALYVLLEYFVAKESVHQYVKGCHSP